MEVKILIKKLPVCILYKQKKSLKSALERKVFIVVLRGKAGIFLKIVKILIVVMQEKGVKRVLNGVFPNFSPKRKKSLFF